MSKIGTLQKSICMYEEFTIPQTEGLFSTIGIFLLRIIVLFYTYSILLFHIVVIGRIGRVALYA